MLFAVFRLTMQHAAQLNVLAAPSSVCAKACLLLQRVIAFLLNFDNRSLSIGAQLTCEQSKLAKFTFNNIVARLELKIWGFWDLFAPTASPQCEAVSYQAHGILVTLDVDTHRFCLL
jgi:hypothetical protein